jgi:uracil-DNA glycosylase
MKPILFVGDAPSRKNTDMNVAFVGTKSGKTLLEWIDVLEVKNYKAINRVDKKFVTEVVNNMKEEGHIVALGKRAENDLKNLGVEFFTLPHPSPKNRKLNDKEEINKLLNELKPKLV